MKPVMTREEIENTPAENRYYECQQCDKRGTDLSDYRMIVVFKIGFVMCRNCLGGES